MDRRRIIAGLSVLVGVVLLSCPALGDGGYWPEPAFPAMPKIPVQRAIVVHRDGVETLVVESAFESASPNVGWILPLPAEPTGLDVADSGMLTSLAMCLRPEISHDLRYVWLVPLLLFLGSLPVAFVVIVSRDRKHRRRNLVALAALYLALFLVSTTFMASMGTAGAGDGPGVAVSVVSTQRVGAYDVTVLRADSSDALSEWLTDGKLKPLDAAAKEIISDYIKRKWCFVVARLRRDAGGPGNPHPIKATFPAPEPVYPMKLTAVAGTKTLVELFVVADTSVVADGFHVAACDRYRKTTTTPERFRTAQPRLEPFFEGATTGLLIGHPDVGDLLWAGCVVTRLTARLSPAQMDRDVTIRRVGFKAHRDHVFSPTGARHVTAAVLLWGALAAMLLSAAACRGRRRPKRREAIAIAAVGLLAVLGAGITRAALPVMPVRAGVEMTGWMGRWRMAAIVSGTRWLEAETLLHAGMSDDEFRQYPDLLLSAGAIRESGVINPFTGEKMTFERSPGNFSIRRVGRVTCICLYDDSARELRIRLRGPGPGD